MVWMVEKAEGDLRICAVYPALVTSTDDTTQYVFSGTVETKNTWWLTSEKATRNGAPLVCTQKANQMKVGMVYA
jgi:hypothetical protein